MSMIEVKTAELAAINGQGLTAMSDLPKRLRIKAGMIALGERIAWGSDTALMEEAADVIEALSASVENHQLHMLGIARDRDQLRDQLRAIRQVEGEDVAVLATVSMGGVEYGIAGAELGDIDIEPDMDALCALQQSLVTGDDDAHVELIDKAQHQRIVDALAAELAAIKGQEPVAWIVPDFGFLFPTEDAAQRYLRNINDLRKPTALYTLPAAPEGGGV